MTKRILAALLFVLAFGIAPAFADDCGNGKDHGKGAPSCHQGGNGGNGGNNGGGSPVVVTNDNLNNVSLTNNNHVSSSSTSNSSSNSSSNSAATATGGNASANQTQTAQGGNASNGGQSNSQTTVFQQAHQTASAMAPESNATAPCRVAGSGGGQGPFFGFSFSGSKLDSECEKRATAIAFAQLGMQQAAVEMLCATKAAQATHVQVCIALEAYKKLPKQDEPTSSGAAQ